MRLEFMPAVVACGVADLGDCEAIVEEPMVEEPMVEEPMVEELMVEEAMVDEAMIDEAISEDAIVDDCVSCRVDDLGKCCWWGELHFCARPLFKDFKRPATAIGASSDTKMLAKIA